MNLTKITLAAMAILIYTLIVVNLVPGTDLEIYTQDDIYYIDGLTVTREASNEGYIFTTPEDMKKFIAELTANDTRTALVQ